MCISVGWLIEIGGFGHLRSISQDFSEFVGFGIPQYRFPQFLASSKTKEFTNNETKITQFELPQNLSPLTHNYYLTLVI